MRTSLTFAPSAPSGIAGRSIGRVFVDARTPARVAPDVPLGRSMVHLPAAAGFSKIGTGELAGPRDGKKDASRRDHVPPVTASMSAWANESASGKRSQGCGDIARMHTSPSAGGMLRSGATVHGLGRGADSCIVHIFVACLSSKGT